MAAECIFCQIVEGKIPSTTVDSGENWLAFRDIQPQAPHHLLVIPKRHIATIEDLQATDQELCGELVLAAQRVARQEGLSPQGYRLVFNVGSDGGQAVAHIHLHVLGGRALSWPPG